MLTLIHAPKSRSSRFIWLLEELETDYAIIPVAIRRGDGSGERDPGNPHPHGKVPVIIDEHVTIFESAAIAVYLTDAFPKNGIGPLVGDKQRGPYLTWLAYYAGVVEPAFLSKFMKVVPPRGTAGWVAVEEVMPYITDALEKGPYLLGDTFSAADVLFGSTFSLFMGHEMLPRTKVLQDYVKRCTDRPAYARAAAKDG